MNSNSVACPLDCYDACQATFEKGSCKPDVSHVVTNGKLCKNFAHLVSCEKLTQAYHEKKECNLDSALNVLVEKLKQTEPSKVLYYKGSGNIGVMQNAPRVFFDQYGAVFTRGSLCDGGGGEGLEQGRGSVISPPLEHLLNADIILCWGRNFSVTSPHLYRLVKDKTFITIDPVVTDIAKKSEIHLQINPKTDHELALLMTRFAYMNDMEDEDSFKSYAKGADWFFDLAKERPLVSYESTTGVVLSDVSKAMDLMKNKKVAIMVGLGVQKYYEGASIMRSIDSFAAYIGVHNKDAGGLWYLSDSAYGYENQFAIEPKKRVDIPSVNFADYDVVFIQGANPVISAPNTKRVIAGLKETFVVFFGTTYNETAEYANLVIPSANFLAKSDVRLSYGHEYKAISSAVEAKEENSISEYDLSAYLLEHFSFNAMKSEKEIMDYYANTQPKINRQIEKFEFVEELAIVPLYEDKEDEDYYLITAKRGDSLNSQFNVDHFAYVNPESGYKEDDEVLISSEFGEANFIVKLCEDVKSNCVLIYAGAKNVNALTPHKSDEASFSAMYQEVLINIELS